MFEFSSRAFNTHECRFKYDERRIAEDQIPVTILTKPKNMEKSLPILMMLSDVDLIKLCQTQSWWIPNIYPFVFPGSGVRTGSQGLPPILKACTANKESKHLLKLLINVEGKALLPRNIVIVHEDGSKSFIPESMLVPLTQFNTEVLPSVISVTIGGNLASSGQSSSSDVPDLSDDDDDNNDNDEDNDAEQDANNLDGDDAIVMENRRPPTSQLRHVLALQSDPRFSPGLDGYGSLHIEQRKVTIFRYPWIMTPAEFEVHCRLTKSDFFDFVESCRGAPLRLKKSSLNIYAQCFLFLLKVSHGYQNYSLASMFAVGERTVRDVFIRICLHRFTKCNNIPNILDLNGALVQSERDKLLETAYADTPIYFKQLVKDFKDPSGRGRKGIILNVDSTYLDTTSGQDIGKCVYVHI